jgi:hypothetical protein
MLSDDHEAPGSPEVCGCFAAPLTNLQDARDLGIDSHFAEVSVLACENCGQPWLRYFYEVEAFTASGRWYLGAITKAQISDLTPAEAKPILQGLRWYFYGGSFFEGRIGKSSGPILLSP